MVATIVADNQTIDKPTFKNGEHVLIMSETELERQINNAVYLAELNHSMKQSKAGKVVRHELIEVDDEFDLD